MIHNYGLDVKHCAKNVQTEVEKARKKHTTMWRYITKQGKNFKTFYFLCQRYPTL